MKVKARIILSKMVTYDRCVGVILDMMLGATVIGLKSMAELHHSILMVHQVLDSIATTKKYILLKILS